jgi:chromosome partitioning protein
VSLTEQLKKIIGFEEQSAMAPRARVLAVAARKGGVGKTTTTVNLAVAMARYFKLEVLMVDMDGQGHVTEALSAVIRDRGGASLSDVLLSSGREVRRVEDLNDIAVPTSEERLYVTPSDKGLAVTEGILSGMIGREFLLRNVMRKAAARFDVIIFDCPPNVGNLTLNALVASSHVLVPCDMSVLSLAAVGDIVGVVDTVNEQLGHNLQVLGVLPTRVDRRNGRLTDEIMAELERSWGSRMCRTRIPANTSLARAQMSGVPIFDFEPRSAGAVAYRKLAAEALGRMGFSGVEVQATRKPGRT